MSDDLIMWNFQDVHMRATDVRSAETIELCWELAKQTQHDLPNVGARGLGLQRLFEAMNHFVQAGDLVSEGSSSATQH